MEELTLARDPILDKLAFRETSSTTGPVAERCVAFCGRAEFFSAARDLLIALLHLSYSLCQLGLCASTSCSASEIVAAPPAKGWRSRSSREMPSATVTSVTRGAGASRWRAAARQAGAVRAGQEERGRQGLVLGHNDFSTFFALPPPIRVLSCEGAGCPN